MAYTSMPILDQQAIEQMISDTGPEVVPLIIDSYLQESEQRLANIDKAVEQSDCKMLEFEAHTLGSTSLALGVQALGLLAREIEQRCLEGDHAKAFALHAEVNQVALQSRSALETLKQTL
ncbi:Hpt domain-containing protein [Vibrio sp. WXL103]|uniref:Hpt domain-containing protein n=1 Tax=unclassified Vibrio TaxID=2614977 RepID=UPI003EC55F37